jgi:hypothetical protein
MGTQFTSRLTESDRKRIRDGIREAHESVLPEGIVPVTAMTGTQVRKLGEMTVRQVLSVVYGRGFSAAFEGSTAFEDVLRWLKRLLNDAKYAGFEGVIEELQIKPGEAPIPRLSGQLREILSGQTADQFRAAAQMAAMAILVQAVTANVTPKQGEPHVKKFGRQISTLELPELVTSYVEHFIYTTVIKFIKSSVPAGGKQVNNAVLSSEKVIRRIAKKAVGRLDEDNLCNEGMIHQIVMEELSQFV